MTTRAVVIGLVFAASTASATPDPWAGGGSGSAAPFSELKGPTAEVGRDLKQPLPPVPAFELPVSPAGTHSVHELAVKGRPLFGTEIKVNGYVIWIYDCVTAVQTAGMTRASVQKKIDADPTLCERKKLYLGDAKDTPLERGLWVVDVPRPPNKLEKERLPKAEIAAWPAVPELSVGMYVTVTGTFTTSSPHSERNSDGLLVWKSFERATPAPLKMVAVGDAVRTVLPLASIKPVARPPKDLTARGESVKASNAGTKAYGAKQYPEALASYKEAVKYWDGNHVAWYGMTGVHIGLGNWNDAAAAIRSAFEVAPNDPMYAMVYGYALYERQIDQARQDQARREGRDPKSVNPDLSAVDFQQAEQLLRHAIKLNDQLWRAHYYLGRIARDTGRPKLAAEELTKALSREPTAPGPWVALAEIYRQWQRPDLAIATSSIGALIVDDSSDVWFELGMGFDDMRANEKAVDAFTKALDAKADNVKVRFQRGQALVRLKKYRDAKSDLDAVMAAKWPDSDFAKQQAKKMLLDIAAKRGR